jgi:hypothetical protein
MDTVSLKQVIESGNTEALKAALRDQPSLGRSLCRCSCTDVLLICAIDTLNVEIVQLLIEAGADFNQLWYRTNEHDPDVVPDTREVQMEDSILLHAMCKEIRRKDCPITTFLLERGTKVDPPVGSSSSYLSFCCRNPEASQFFRMLYLLVQSGASRKTVMPKLWKVFDEGMRHLYNNGHFTDTPSRRLSTLNVWTSVSLFANEPGSKGFTFLDTFFLHDSRTTLNEICRIALGTIDPKFATYLRQPPPSDRVRTAVAMLSLAPIKAVFAVAGHVYALMSGFEDEWLCALAHVDGGGLFPLEKVEAKVPRSLRSSDDLYISKTVTYTRRFDVGKENWRADPQDLEESFDPLRHSLDALEIHPSPGCIMPVVYTKFKWPGRWTQVQVKVLSSDDDFRACLFFDELKFNNVLQNMARLDPTVLDDRCSRRIHSREETRRVTEFFIYPPEHNLYQTQPFRIGLQCERLTVEKVDVEVTEEVLIPQTGLISFGSLPVGSVIKCERDNLVYKYVGYTISNMVYLMRGDVFKCVPMDRSLKLLKKSSAYIPKNLDQLGEGGDRFARLRRKLLGDSHVAKTIRSHLHSQTIRGIPLYDLLNFLHCKCGMEVPVAVVGGAVRDVLLLQDINDVDFVVGRTFSELRNDIERFFALEGIVLSPNVLKCFPEFGMMKLLPIPGVDKESIDIGIFKSNTCTILPQDLRKPDESYIFGFSYDQDSEFRDYSSNAIYFDIFGLESQQLPADAVISLRGGREDAISHAVKLSARNIEIKAADIGGRLRIWKMLKKQQRVTDSSEICKQLKTDALQILHVLDPGQLGHVLGEHADIQLPPDVWVDDWLWNFATKLFKGKVPADEAQDLKELVHEHGDTNGIMWWNIVLIIARVLVAKPSRFLSRICSGDNSESIRVWEVFEVLQKRAPALEITDQGPYIGQAVARPVQEQLGLNLHQKSDLDQQAVLEVAEQFEKDTQNVIDMTAKSNQRNADEQFEIATKYTLDLTAKGDLSSNK